MCGRFTLLTSQAELEARFPEVRHGFSFEESYNVAPGQNVFSIIHDGKQQRAGSLKWGLVPSWANDKRIGYKMINARLETAHEKPSFKRLMETRRCLIVADSFYEWKQKDESKNPFRIQVAGRKLFSFAGLWDKWTDGEETLYTCTILTTASNQFMGNIHHRMPIILPEDKEAEWINPYVQRASDARRFLQEIEHESLEAYRVSSYVNHAKNNDQKCVEALT